jgi:hypothetical protein
MKASPAGGVATTFPVPPNATEAPAAAHAEFDRRGDEWATVRGEIDDAKQAAKAAVGDALRAAVDAVTAGRQAKVDPAALEAEWAAKIAALQSRERVLLAAVDEAGDRLAFSIAESRDEWIESLERTKAVAVREYLQAIEDAKSALAAFAPIGNAIAWLREFEHVATCRGYGTAFPGGRVRIDGPNSIGPLSGQHDPAALLDLAATAAEPPEVVKARALKNIPGTRRFPRMAA